MKTEMTSKERIINTVKNKPTDHIPINFSGLCHGYVSFLDNKFPDKYELNDYLISLGVDTAILIGKPSLPAAYPDCKIKEYSETRNNEQFPVMVKEYETPKGTLSQIVRRQNYESNSIRMFSDFNVPPGRSIRYLIEKEEQLDALEYLFRIPSDHDLEKFRQNAKQARKYCDEKQIMLSGSLQGIGDPLLWMSGFSSLIYNAADNPEFMHRYVKIVSDWNLKWIEIFIENGVDFILRRGWYECTNFWSPSSFREFLLEPLKKETKLAQQSGVLYSYIINAGVTGLEQILVEAGIDIMANPEPDKTDMKNIKKLAGGSVTICSGINNYHTIEKGTEYEVETAVRQAIEILGPGGRFILAPSDSILDVSENAQQNFYKMIDTWKKYA